MSVPNAPAPGVYVTEPLAIAPSEPFDGPSPIESVSGSPSGSVQVSGTLTAEPAAVRRATSWQLGARVIVIAAVAGAEVAAPSDAV